MLKKILLSTGTITVTIATTFAAISCGTTKAPVATNTKGTTGAPAVTKTEGTTKAPVATNTKGTIGAPAVTKTEGTTETSVGTKTEGTPIAAVVPITPGTAGTPVDTKAEGTTVSVVTQAKGTQSVTRGPEQIYTTEPGSSNNFGADVILDKESYNKLYDEMKTHPGTVALAVIANNKVYTDIVNVTRGETVLDVLDSSKFIFKRYMHEFMGAFINSFALRDKPNVFMHGTNTDKNYGDFYPMYYINHKFAQLGVSNFHLAGSEMLEFTYDKQ